MRADAERLEPALEAPPARPAAPAAPLAMVELLDRDGAVAHRVPVRRWPVTIGRAPLTLWPTTSRAGASACGPSIVA